MELQGKVAIITGASSGIGAATARELARYGTTVVLAARRADRLEALAAEIEQAGGYALTVPADISRRDEIDRLVNITLETYGRIDMLVNNAGIRFEGSLFNSDDAALQRIVDVNLLGPMRCISAVVPHMRRQGRGVIINIGSVAGEIGTNSVYSATKFGLRGLNDAVRRELRHNNIALVLIAPGLIRTEMTEGLTLPMPGPETVARAVASAVRRPRRKIFVPWFYAPLVYGVKLLPWLADLLIGSKLFQRRYRERKTT